MSRIAWIVVAFVVIGSAQSALAGQHQNAHLYSFWNWSDTGFWNVDQLIRIEEKGTATFWAEQFLWAGRSDGGYLGLQTHGNPVSGRRGDTAIFSVWNATAARGSCEPFAGEGVGRKCAVAYPFETDRYYRLRIWRLEADAEGQWWGAWVYDTVTGANTWIGSIRAPTNAVSIRTTTNFVEYYGPQVSCSLVPRSTAVFTQPAANYRASSGYEFGSSYSSSNLGSCTRGQGTAVDLDWTSGVRAVHGSRVPSATRVLFVHGFERGGTNNCEGTWGEMMDAFRELGWTGNFIPIRYYADDILCNSRTRMWNVDLGAYGSHDKTHPSGHVEWDGVIVGHSTDARIKHLAQHLAWTIYDRYTKRDDPIKIVAHSMGGLITRSAIKETQARNPDFPPRLLIEDVVTLGTPHTGAGFANFCAATHEQCRDLRPDSSFLNDLDHSDSGHNPQADGLTEWTLVGAGDDDAVTNGSATNMLAPEKVVYHSHQGIEHGQYPHKKTGSLLRDTSAGATIEHHGVRCNSSQTFWPVALSWTALAHQVDDCAVP